MAAYETGRAAITTTNPGMTWRAAIPTGNGTLTATRTQVEAAARSIYAGYPEILDALGLR